LGHKKLRISITGHRHWTDPKKERKRLFDNMDSFMFLLLKEYRKENIVLLNGCATGVDQWFGIYALQRDLRFELYLPFKRTIQVVKGKMTPKQIESLNDQYRHADKVVVVNDKFFTYGYQKRNIALVNNCQILLTYYTRSRSGSGNCLRYAVEKGRRIVNLREFSNLYSTKTEIWETWFSTL